MTKHPDSITLFESVSRPYPEMLIMPTASSAAPRSPEPPRSLPLAAAHQIREVSLPVLSIEERAIIMRAAQALPQALRQPFAETVIREVQAHAQAGPGAVAQVVARVQRRFRSTAIGATPRPVGYHRRP
jgi:hypothetical protein